MATLKEFLKPNWWKVGGVIIMILLYFTMEIGIKNIVVGKAPEVISGGKVVVYQPVSEPRFNPIIYPFANALYKRDFIKTSQTAGTLYLVTVFIYWYLLACLIHFVFVKIKNKFVAKK